MSRSEPIPSGTEASHTVPQPMTRRWTRPNVVLGKIIPTALAIFAVRGYSLVILEIIPYLWVRRPVFCALYAAVVHVALAMTAYSYFTVYFQSLGPPPEKEPPVEVREKRVIYACDASGDPLRCRRDRCSGAWQSIRTRHCRDCATCRPIFDHHCGFMDNCVCGATLKPFTCFLAWAAVLLLVALVPLTPLQWRACRAVITETWWTDEMCERWWKGWKGWVGGPVYRYAGALILGYRQYHHPAQEYLLGIPDARSSRRDALAPANVAVLYPTLAVPTLAALFVTFAADMITVIALIMLYVVTHNARRGLTSVQCERIKLHRRFSSSEHDGRVRLWVPLPEGGGAVVLVEPDLPLFDLGKETNWRRLMGHRKWEWALPWVPSRVTDMEMNPDVVAELEERARKQA